ncbi:hypothetical protein L1785_02660 [Antribacter sp. KLBMP9083]|uniref:Uncharacterized protein n=1 Tax=Antribacter soli TaxID=2910976 RepID=A0AA41QC32_9MICO|nr:hypothetical protein [Antribacter soli]MCF4119871.1 hypothetical protein [Antribacter soli]
MKPGRNDIDSLSAGDAGALCCATAIRWGGALGAIAEGFELGSDYNLVDRGVRAALSRHQGGEFQRDVISEGHAASWLLGTILFEKGELATFLTQGIVVADYAMMTARDGDGGSVLKVTLKRAMETARLWPWPVGLVPFSSLAELESKCQEDDLARILSGGTASLVAGADVEAQRFRSIAEARQPPPTGT